MQDYQSLLPSPGYALICTGISLSSPLSSNALCFLLASYCRQRTRTVCIIIIAWLLNFVHVRNVTLNLNVNIEWYAIRTRKDGTEMVELNVNAGQKNTRQVAKSRVGSTFGPLSAVRPPQLVCRVWVAGLRWTTLPA